MDDGAVAPLSTPPPPLLPSAAPSDRRTDGLFPRCPCYLLPNRSGRLLSPQKKPRGTAAAITDGNSGGGSGDGGGGVGGGGNDNGGGADLDAGGNGVASTPQKQQQSTGAQRGGRDDDGSVDVAMRGSGGGMQTGAPSAEGNEDGSRPAPPPKLAQLKKDE